jgi:hypothetical protein
MGMTSPVTEVAKLLSVHKISIIPEMGGKKSLGERQSDV